MSDITPYERNKIYCGQSEELLARLPEGCIDLTVTSPPYDNLRTYKGFTLDWHEIIRQLYRVTKPGGVVVWVVADATVNGSETGTSFQQALWAMECGFNCETMIYEAKGTGAKGSNYYYPQTYEFMFVWAKGQPKTSNRIRDKKNTTAGTTRSNSGDGKYNGVNGRNQRTVKIADYGYRTNIWQYKTGNCNGDDQTVHNAPFPEALVRDHIISWSNPGDLVLDPFMGSGTTAKMAMQNGRHYLGFDISEEYCELARKRVAWANPPLLVVS